MSKKLITKRDWEFMLIGVLLSSILSIGTGAFGTMINSRIQFYCGEETYSCIEWANLGVYAFSIGAFIVVLRIFINNRD
jgi:hypothetical protein